MGDFEDIRKLDNSVELLVKWQGISEEETGWVSLDSLHEDVPELVQKYIQHVKIRGTTRQKALVSQL